MCIKKLARTAALTVLANFFLGLIFQNPILQQALLLFWCEAAAMPHENIGFKKYAFSC